MIEAPPARIWQPIEGAVPGLFRFFLESVLGAVEISSVTSWWRSPVENFAVGGKPFSQHLIGFALDFTTPDPRSALRQLANIGLVAVDEGDHVHVQLLQAGVLDPLIHFLTGAGTAV